MRRKANAIIIVAIAFSLGACVRDYQEVTPDEGPSWKTTETRPLFRWSPSKQEGVKYDLAVFERQRNAKPPMPGKIVYLREGLDKPEHKTETPLIPGDYLWAVRTRTGQNVGGWSNYGEVQLWGLPAGAIITKSGHFFSIAIIAPKYIVNHENLPIPHVEGKATTAERVREIIMTVAAEEGWIAKPVADGLLYATFNKGKYMIAVDITYSATSYSVRYRDSTNLNYRKSGAEELIHPTYNRWVTTLVHRVGTKLQAGNSVPIADVPG
jgi:hypothetical protein